MISEELIDLLNYRIQMEENSSRLYKAMAIYLDDVGYLGAAKLWTKYAGEEMTHAEWARDFLLDLAIRPETRSLDEQPQSFEGLPQIIRQTLEHEVDVTRQCEELAKRAMIALDFKVFGLAMKYVNEQVEELKKATTLVDMLELFGESQVSLQLLDEKLGGMA